MLLYSYGDNGHSRGVSGSSIPAARPQARAGSRRRHYSIARGYRASPSEASARRAHTENRPSARCSVFLRYPSASGRDPHALRGFFVPVSQKVSLSFVYCHKLIIISFGTIDFNTEWCYYVQGDISLRSKLCGRGGYHPPAKPAQNLLTRTS